MHLGAGGFMGFRLRAELLGLCAQLEALSNSLERYRASYSAKLSELKERPGTEGMKATLSRVLDELEAVADVVNRIRSLACSGEPGLQTLVRAYHIADQAYYKMVAGHGASVPASIRSAFYEIYRTLKSIAL